MNLLFLDTESYFNSKDFTLRKMSTIEYVRDERFKLHGFGYAFGDEPVKWIRSVDSEAALRSFDWSTIAMVCHNAKHDGSILAERYKLWPAQYRDTMAMSRAVLGATVVSHSLDSLSHHFGLSAKGQMKTDGIRDLTPEQEAELGEYCVHDVELCREIYKHLEGKFPKSQISCVDHTIRCFTEPVLVLNAKLAAETAVAEEKRRESIIKASGVEKSDLSSNPKFAALLAQHGYECPVKKSPKTAKEIPALALGDEAFLDMLESEDDKLRALCESRVAAKSTLLTTRAARFAKIGLTGPWPFDIQFSGAKQTHRYSGGSGGGGNPQNLTRGSALRRCVEAPQGHKLVVGDFSSIELRIQAYLCRETHMIQQLEGKRDMYCDFASAHYGRLITKEDKEQRQFGKISVLGLGYNMGAKKFAHTVFIQLKQKIEEGTARKAVNLYRMMYPGIPKMWGYLQSLLPRMADGQKGCLPFLPAVKWDGPKFILPSGLEVKYPGLSWTPGNMGPEWHYTGFRDKSQTPQTVNVYGGKLLENLCQALAGEICKEAIERVKGLAPTPIQVHDEIGQVVPDGWEKDAAEELEKAMSTSPSWWPEIRLSAEVGVGMNWLEAKS